PRAAGRGDQDSLVAAVRQWEAWEESLVAEAIELHRIVAGDLALGLGRDGGQLAGQELLAVGPDAIGVREVRAPHDVVLAQVVEQLDADRVGLVGGVELPVPVLAGLPLELEVLELVL